MRILAFVLLFLSIVSIAAAQSPVQVATVSVSSESAQAEQVIAELASPRLTLETFLKHMDSFVAGENSAIDFAIGCLDLSEIPEFIRKEQGQSLAIKLHTILSKTKIDFWKVPAKDTGTSFVIRSDEYGHLTLEKKQSNWRFSSASIRNIPELFFNLKDQKVLRDTALLDPAVSIQFSLRQYMPEVLSKRIYALEYWQLIGIILSLLVAFLVKKVGYWIFKKITNYIVSRFKAFPASHSVNSFVTPLSYIAAAYGYHLCLYLLLDLDPVVYSSLLRILQVIKILALFIFIVRALDLIAEIMQNKPGRYLGSSAQVLIPLARTGAKVIVIFVGLALIASLYSFNITGIMAGLGIGGLALALAAKDTLENLFGSITVLFDKPFKVGDFITIDGISGNVENIGIRSTRLRTPEHSLVTIPNSKLISVSVDNLGARQFFRTRVSLGITYETPVDKLQEFCERIRQLLKNNPAVRYDYFVHFNQFDTSSLNILMQAYFQANSYADHLARQEELFINIIKIAKELGVDFAYPVQRHV